jgi:hypothetical protein
MKIKKEAEKEGVYGIGVYTDRYCEQELMTYPMKKIDERMEIARCFEGVDFVFSVDSREQKQIEEKLEESQREM